MTSASSSPETTTKRISDEVFADVERELAATSAAVAEALPTRDRLDALAAMVLPYVWTTAIGVWVSGVMLLRTLVPTAQCIGVGIVTIGVLSSIVFAWRCRKTA